MPEIKHQFTGGKMNKDLDERLVPNGEYRDALNIEVSTSEGSDVGTVQNILGNSLIAGQDFIGENAVCVGSIADEKNDKLYYFITQKNLLLNGSFDNNGSGWEDGSPEWTFSNNQAVGTSGEAGTMHASAPGVVDGNMYTITYDIVVASSSGGLILANHSFIGGINTNGTDDNVHLGQALTYATIGTYTIEWEQGPSSSRQNNIWLHNTTTYSGAIDNIFVFRSDLARSCIIEYDSKTNTITPVLVDVFNDTLKFNPDNIITGINIIDDLLFWTDNESEPKKINIQRSILGTDVSGTIHTNFINNKRDPQLEEPIREEHITVIKKAPKVAPTIELISERDPSLTWSGVMRISTAPTEPLIPRGSVNGGNNQITNAQNSSSMWLDNDSWANHHHDFTSLKVGNTFDTQIETKLDGTSGFTLGWEGGDIIVFKEFGGDNFDEAPGIPITGYSVKAKIIQGNTYPILTDEITEITQNGNFTIPNYNGNKPQSLTYSSGIGIVYEPSLNRLECTNVDINGKIYSTYAPGFGTGDVYTVSMTVSDHITGRVAPRLFDGNSNYWADGWRNPSGAGLHTHTWVIDTSTTAYGWSGTFYDDKFHFDFDTQPGFTGNIESISITRPAQNAAVRCKVLAINNPPVALEEFGELKFAVDRLDTEEKLFEFKFPRFAYRYQYEDREYSTMSPFSQIAFMPGSFDYHPKKGYNLGMTNRVNEIGIKNFTTNVPDGVIAIDILYKDDLSPNIYVVDTIKPKHSALGGGGNVWDADGDPLTNSFVVTSEQISQMLPSNQLLRLWDNVPKKALAQDISGNRIIYGNYTQGFDLKAGDINASEDYYPDFNFSVMHDDNTSLNPKKSIKSLREYQLGVVFVDEYGRETPVISNRSGTYKLDKLEAEKINQIQVDFNNEKYPENMKYFKFFIKETSGEYYNLAMDRYYDAEDGQMWLSFPSSDRNKLDEDTFLILKKGVESNEMVSADAKYKVLDIQNEAPDFIKFDKRLIEERTHVHQGFSNDVDIFGNTLTNIPLAGNDSFKMNYSPFESETSSDLHKIEDSDLHIEFANATNNISKRYRIAKITTDYIDGTVGAAIAVAKYSVKLDKQLGDDVNFITDDDSGLSPTKIDNGTVVNIYKYTKENSSKFDGRFFVKINVDSAFNENITIPSVISTKYRTVASKKLYYMHPDNSTLHSSDLTGQTHGQYAGGFGRFAPFFRNYKVGSTDASIDTYTGTAGVYGSEFVGQYMFGDQNDAKKELAWITTMSVAPAPSTGGSGATSGFVHQGGWPGVKIADDHGWNNTERAGKFNGAGEQEEGEVWFIDEGPYYGSQHNTNSLTWGTGSTRKINPGYTNPIGISNGVLEIAVGGVYHSDWGHGAGGSISQFFSVGKSGGNPNYTASATSNLVEKFYPGQKFRFKEDPNKEVYTIQPTIDVARRARWGTIPTGITMNYAWKWYDNAYPTPGWSDADPSNAYGPMGSNFMQFTKQLSPNLTRGWKPKFLNSSGNTTVNWDPTGDPGPIIGGLQLSISHSSTDSGGTAPDKYVVVDSLLATNHDGTTRSITTGMILTSHSNGVSGHVYDGTAGGFEPLAIKEITTSGTEYHLHLTGYSKILSNIANSPLSGDVAHDIFSNPPVVSQTMVFEQPKMNGYSQYSVNRLNAQHSALGGIMAIGYTLEFVEAIESESIIPSNPAIWETEPKESTDLDIYYETGGLNPLKLENDTRYLVIPLLSTVEHIGSSYGANWIEAGTTVEDVIFDGTDWAVTLASPSDDAGAGGYVGSLVSAGYIAQEDKLKITKPGGDIVIVEITDWPTPDGDGRTSIFKINSTLYGNKTQYNLNWHNCYSFGNGVESNRIRDNFNLPYISNGVKVSTTLDEGLGEEHRKYGLIYSGIYNSNSSINNLNQFIAAEKITKDINPIYGSIQKLHSRDSDLVTLCEDKCLRIMANKDAVFNADGNANLTATNRVLGQTFTFSGEFGISKNPESFASESYRVYFTDKVRGTVMRLSKDGLTPISMYGMKDWFKDNLKLSTKLIGSYDDRKDEYNITLADRKTLGEELIVNGNFETDYVEWFGSKTHWFWDSVNKNLFSDGNPHSRIGQYFPTPITAGKSYEISYTVGQPQDGSSLQGRLWVTLHDDSTNYKSIGETGTYGTPTTVGTYTETVTVDSSWGYWQYTVMLSSINFHNKETIQSDGIFFNGTIDNISVKEIISDPITVSFKEDVKGWVSFKSFVLENGLSVASDYYTVLSGKLYKHHIENTNRNNFYGIDYNSSVNVLLNDGPGSVKSFHTLDYEGSQSRIIQNLQDNDYYNLTPKDGWYVSGIETNKQVGSINEFIEKEGKWFNYIKGVDSDITSETDFGAFDIQGIGMANNVGGVSTTSIILELNDSINVSLQIGDTIYFQQPTTNGSFNVIDSGEIVLLGTVTSIDVNIIVSVDNSSGSYLNNLPAFGYFLAFPDQHYIMFAKNHAINTSSLVGYFADVKFENNSTGKIELFSVGSEITGSSK